MYYILFINLKKMNATMSLRLDENLKEDFSKYAKSLWVDPSMLLRRFISSCLKRSDAVIIDINEVIFEETLDEVMKSSKVQSKLKTLWNKLTKLK